MITLTAFGIWPAGRWGGARKTKGRGKERRVKRVGKRCGGVSLFGPARDLVVLSNQLNPVGGPMKRQERGNIADVASAVGP